MLLMSKKSIELNEPDASCLIIIFSLSFEYLQ